MFPEDDQQLIPCIVQNYLTGSVLMLGYMNKEAFERTKQTKQVTFFSRSRQQLWTKGETSGNYLELKKLMFDCDNDTILVHADPKGPTCHNGTASCFLDSDPQLSFLNKLESIIDLRKSEKSENSYTAQLFSQGLARMCQKVGEEGVEVSLAAIQGNKQELKQESADLIFHLMVLLRSQNLSIHDVIDVLQSRHNS